MASLSTATVHSGSQSVLLSLTSASDYGRVKLDVSSYGLTLGQITSADYWVNRQSTNEQSPYILFSITTPGHGPDAVLAILYNDPSLSNGEWRNIQIGASSTFHVEGDGTGLNNPGSIRFGDLQSSFYSPGVTWGSLPVNFVRIGMGLGSNDGVAATAFVDDLTINTAGVPEPGTSALVLAALGALGVMLRRRKS